MSELHSSRAVAAAIGAAVGVIGAVGIFIFQKVMEKKQGMVVKRDLERMDKVITEMKVELENLRLQQSQQKNRKKPLLRRRKVSNTGSTHPVTDNDTDVDAFSTAGTDFDDDEFYDFSDSELGDADNVQGTPGAVNELNLILSEVEKQIEGSTKEQEAALSILRNLATLHPGDVEVAWRLGRVCHKCSSNTTDRIIKQELILEGIEACERFKNSSSADLHKWFAILVGSHGEFLPTKDKIENGYLFKEHVDKAVELRPEDPLLYHLMGRFKYEVANLSWIERKVAATLFAEPPSATYEEAIADFEQAEKLTSKPWKENRFLLGRCFIALGQYQSAVHWLQKVCEIPIISEDDRRVQTEVDQLLSKYSKYR